jgi:hypothetical protein
MATDPKLSDPIVFTYDKAHLKLTANTIDTTDTKQAITWREAVVNENRAGVFGVTLDTTNGREAAKQAIVFNKAGIFMITSSVSKKGTANSHTQIGLTTDIRFPGASASFEIDYQFSTLNDFHTLPSSITFRVLPNQIGTQLYVNVKSGAGSPPTTIRGYNYSSNSFDDGATAGSWLDIIYPGA